MERQEEVKAFKKHRLISCRSQGMGPLKTKVSRSNSFSMEGQGSSPPNVPLWPIDYFK